MFRRAASFLQESRPITAPVRRIVCLSCPNRQTDSSFRWFSLVGLPRQRHGTNHVGRFAIGLGTNTGGR